jgi:hypothetical protein
MDRSSDASLSPIELASLRQVGADSRNRIPSAHRALLVGMHLVRSRAGVLIVTDQGRHRLRQDRVSSTEWQTAITSSNEA